MFSIIAGTNEDHKVPTWAAILIGCILALFIVPAVVYRTYTTCRQPAIRNQNNQSRVEDITDNDNSEPRRLALQPPALGQNPQNFYQSSSVPVMVDVPSPKDTDPLIPIKEKGKANDNAARCVIL